MFVTVAFKGLRQEAIAFEASLSYVVAYSFKASKQTNKDNETNNLLPKQQQQRSKERRWLLIPDLDTSLV